MGNKAVFTALIALMLLAGMAAAQDKVPDPGIPDTAIVQSVTRPSGSTSSFAVTMTLYNDETLGGFGMPVRWDSPDIICDSITFTGSRVAYVMNKPTEIDTVGQKINVGMIILFEAYLSPGRGNVYTIWFSALPGAEDQIINLDSTSFRPAAPFVLVLSGGQTFVPQFIKGTVTLGTPPTDPTISLSPGSLSFNGVQNGSNPPSQNFTITNTGAGTLNWTASDNAAWLTLNPASGTGNATVAASVNIAGLSAGTHNATITVSDPAATNSPRTISVQLVLTAPPPCLSLSTNSLNFSGDPGQILVLPVNVSNCGGQTLSWTVTGINAGWLSATPLSGTNSGTVNFTANLTGLTSGDYHDTVTFAGASGTGNSPQNVIINLIVSPPTSQPDIVRVVSTVGTAGQKITVNVNYENFATIGAISLPLWFSGTGLTCDSVSFVGSRIAYMTEHLAGIDNDEATILISGLPIAPDPFLAPGSGLLARLYFSIAPDAPTQVATIDSSFIPPYGDFLFLDTAGVVRPTEFYFGQIAVTGLPCFDFPVDTVYTGAAIGNPAMPQTFVIGNVCYGTLNWTVTDNATWLAIAPGSGSAGATVEFSFNTAGLGEGDYMGIVTFNSNAINSPYQVPVKMNIFAVPDLALSTTAIDLGSICRGQSVDSQFSISNVGTGTLNWTASAGSGITLSAASGTAPATVDFSLNTTAFPFGVQHRTITVDAGTAEHSPQTITVTVNVLNCDECTFDIAEVNGPQGLPVGVPIYAYNMRGIAGLEFHLTYDDEIIDVDSVTSAYMTSPTIGYPPSEIHYVWDNLSSPMTVPDGGVIMTLWFTSIGNIGQVGMINWLPGVEVVDTLGLSYLGLGLCEGSVTVIEPIFDISGEIVYYDGLNRPVPNVDVDLSGPFTAADMTDAMGAYLFPDLQVGTYSVTPSRENDDPGVSVADVIKIRRHLAYVERFDSPYEMIAGDVNLTNTVSVADVISIRRYLAQIDPLPGDNWTFVDSRFAINMNNWPSAPRAIQVTLYANDVVVQDFYGVRLGDVNATWAPTAAYAKALLVNSGNLTIEIGQNQGASGEIIAVPVLVSAVSELAGVELHLAYNGNDLQYAGIESDYLAGATVNGTSDAVHIVWENFEAPLALTGGQLLATINFRTTAAFEETSDIAFIGAEAVNAEGLLYPLNLVGGKLVKNTALPTEYALEQNTPNPFNPGTTIRAAMRDAGTYSLTIFNITGQAIKTYQGYHEAGGIEFVWDGTDEAGLPVASGIYLYRFQAGQFSQTKKMMLLK